MATLETNTRSIIRRLDREGWVNLGGGKHDVFRHPDGRKIVVPRHRTQSIGVARGIAEKAGWT
ncbi:MAG TPA: type II toxin-antitoxin system HicA family toxin [Hyphomicrobiaceae bacterium]